SGHAQDASEGEPPPVPDSGTTAQSKCIDQNTEYTTSGKSVFYVMKFANKCEARMECVVFAYTINARGPAQGRATLILGPKSDAAAAPKSYAMRVKGVGGFAPSARECRVI